jgi:hypothetical protein
MLTQNFTQGHSRGVFGFVLLVGVAYWQIVVLGIGGRSVEIWKQGRGFGGRFSILLKIAEGSYRSLQLKKAGSRKSNSRLKTSKN